VILPPLGFFSFWKGCFLKRHLKVTQDGQGRVKREGWKVQKMGEMVETVLEMGYGIQVHSPFSVKELDVLYVSEIPHEVDRTL